MDQVSKNISRMGRERIESMIHLHASKTSAMLPTGKLTFEGSTKDLQSMLQKLKIARNWDKETRTLLTENEIQHALEVLK